VGGLTSWPCVLGYKKIEQKILVLSLRVVLLKLYVPTCSYKDSFILLYFQFTVL